MSGSAVTNYFYAEDDAAFYDATVELTTEAYDLLHQQVGRLVETWRSAQVELTAPLILDIGAGTGAEALRILRAVPNARLICVDASPRMLEALHRKVALEFGDPTAGGRCESILADAYAPGWLPALAHRLELSDTPFNLIVSVYLYHHLTADQKAPIYKEIYRHLAAGGVFIHGDLFSYVESSLAVRAQGLEDRWLTNSFSDPTICQNLGLSEAEALRLLEKWLQHYREDNNPIPICSADPDDDQTECGLLHNAGFKTVEVPFRLFQNGVVWASA